MKVSYHLGYLLMDSGKSGPLYVAPHSGLAFHNPSDHQDYNTHFIAFRLACMSGKALTSSITRERDLGLDLYRLPPDLEKAIKAHDDFQKKRRSETRKYRATYSFTAKDEEEYNLKASIHEGFWKLAKQSSQPLVFIHRQFFNPIRHPSLIDVTPAGDEDLAKLAVDHINQKHRKLFDDIIPMYKRAFEYKGEYTKFRNEIEKAHKIRVFRGRRPDIEKRARKFETRLAKFPFVEVTHKRNFKGKYLKMIMGCYNINSVPCIQFEISEFLTKRFSGIAVHLVDEILKELKYK